MDHAPNGVLLPALLGMAAAVVDETIQLFTPDRGPSLKDVWIDTSGVITGVMLLILGQYVWKKYKLKQS
jgi:VanZ family protein